MGHQFPCKVSLFHKVSIAILIIIYFSDDLFIIIINVFWSFSLYHALYLRYIISCIIRLPVSNSQ